MYNPAGGADVFNFGLSESITDLIIVDQKPFGNPAQLYDVQSRSRLDEYYANGTNSSNALLFVPALGSVMLERLVFGLGARVTGVYYFRLTESGEKDFLTAGNKEIASSCKNAVVEFEILRTGQRKRLWYIEHDLNSENAEFLAFIRTPGLFQTLLVKSAYDIFSPASRIFSREKTGQKIFEPAILNDALVISDLPYDEPGRVHRFFWALVPSTLILRQRLFGVSQAVDFGPAHLLVSGGEDGGKPGTALPGGIDLRRLPFETAGGTLGENMAPGDPDKISAELAALAVLQARGLEPSGRRVKELVVSCGSLLPDYQAEILECIAGIMRREEEESRASGVELKEALALLGKICYQLDKSAL